MIVSRSHTEDTAASAVLSNASRPHAGRASSPSCKRRPFHLWIDSTARASFTSTISVSGAKATLKVKYRCATVAGAHLWVSAKQTKSGRSAARLMKEGSSRASAAWWDTHRDPITCNGAFHTATFTVDHVEKGTKGRLKSGTAWVQFCITTGTTEANTKLLPSKSAWVHVVA